MAIIMMLEMCTDNDLTTPASNLPPETEIANIPIDGDTLFALVDLSWDGGDQDGYILGYEWKYTTTLLSSGEVIDHEWIFTEETSLTISFNSSDTVGNEQVFQVRAIDNFKVSDPDPAVKTLFTLPTIEPELHIIHPRDSSYYFIQENVTDWYYGIPLVFSASDDDGEIVSFEWSVDGGVFNETTDTTLFILPSAFSQPLEGSHEIRVIAYDNTNIASTVRVHQVNLVQPTFEKDILIIDETLESALPASGRISDAKMDSLYAANFRVTDPDDQWDYEYHYLRGDPLPPLSKLGQYKMVVWHADNQPNGPHFLGNHSEYFRNYMNVGGDFVMSGWRVLKSFAWGIPFPATFPDTSFTAEYLHIIEADETPVFLGDFMGANAAYPGFSDVEIDPDKLQGNPYVGKLVRVNTIRSAAGFTDILFRYVGPQDSYIREYADATVGLLYTGTTFNAVVLGFPMYFLYDEDANQLADEILEVLGYN